jgi:hypothetical protein
LRRCRRRRCLCLCRSRRRLRLCRCRFRRRGRRCLGLLGRLQLSRRPGRTRCRRRPWRSARSGGRARRHTAVCRKWWKHGLGFRRPSITVALKVGAGLPRPVHRVGWNSKRQC